MRDKNIVNVAELLYVFLTTHDEVEKYAEIIQSNSSDNCVHHQYNIEILNLFDPELQLTNTKPMIKSKLKRIAKRAEKVQTMLVLEYNEKRL